MKKIGLVGGTGPESTIMYYKELNSKMDNLTDGTAMPELSIESVNFHRAWSYCCQNQYEELADYISKKVTLLVEGGAEIVSLTAGTMHIVFDKVVEKTNAPLVSIPKAVCEEVLARGYKKVGLLGTIFTMEQDYMKKDLIQSSVEVIVPNKTDREFIAKRIYEELERGIVKETTLLEFNDIINKMKKENGIEAIILGCTELPLLLNDDNCAIPCLDSVEIHIQKLINLAMQSD